MKICPHCETGYHDSFITCPTHGILLSEIRDLRPGMLIRGTYRIIRKLGKGGMGAVYLAQHTLIDEPRALKFLSQELSEDEAFTARFFREVRTLRHLRNKNVVDCGDPERAEDGSLFFPMEYVDGPDLRTLIQTAPHPFDVRQALDITRGIAKGLGAAHAKGLVHRDIKPENILMAREGDRWIPKIADFGIVATKESGQQTKTGNVLLTMAYAAPEQWMGTRAAALDGRTDLYALGGLLYEMLTGRPVFDAESYHEWIQKHLSAIPSPPSSLRPDLANWRGLDALVLRLLAKDRRDRPRGIPELLLLLDAVVSDAAVYDPAAVQAADATIAVSPSSPSSETPGKFPLWSGTKPSLEARPAYGPGSYGSDSYGSGYGSAGQNAEPAPRIPEPSLPPAAVPAPAQVQDRFAARVPVESVPQRASLPGSAAFNPVPSGDGDAVASIAAGSIHASGGVASAYPATDRTSRTASNPYLSSGLTSGQGSRPAKRSRGIFVGVLVALFALLAGGGYFYSQHFYVPKVQFTSLRNQTQPILSVAFSQDGQILATGSHDNTIQLWSMVTDKPLNNLPDHVDAVAFGPHGSSLAAADWDGNVVQWDAATGQILATLNGHTGRVLCVAFNPQGGMLASGGSDKTIRLWDLNAESATRVLNGGAGSVNTVAFSPDGKILASGFADNSIKLWDVATGKVLRILQGHTGAVNSVVFSSDHHTLASASDDMTIRLWDVASGSLLGTLHGHTGAVRSIAFSPNGAILASGSDDTSVKLWRVPGGQTAFSTLSGHTASVNSVNFNSDGTILASGSADDTIQLWNMTTVHY
jgi:serine/threonine protein kinase